MGLLAKYAKALGLDGAVQVREAPRAATPAAQAVPREQSRLMNPPRALRPQELYPEYEGDHPTPSSGAGSPKPGPAGTVEVELEQIATTRRPGILFSEWHGPSGRARVDPGQVAEAGQDMAGRGS